MTVAALTERISRLNGFQVACVISGLLIEAETDPALLVLLEAQVANAEEAVPDVVRAMRDALSAYQPRHITDPDSIETGVEW